MSKHTHNSRSTDRTHKRQDYLSSDEDEYNGELIEINIEREERKPTKQPDIDQGICCNTLDLISTCCQTVCNQFLKTGDILILDCLVNLLLSAQF